MGRPLFISIGYSTCHWCHVMARESFEDAEVAMVLNGYFIPVKVDREEMPDVDSFYMSYCLSVSSSCGWPLNVIATPDGKPFYVRTYMSKRELLWVLLQIARAWQSERGEVERVASEALEALKSMWAPSFGSLSFEDVFKSAYSSLSSEYDPVYGGFGSGPKFPVPHNISFLLRYWYRFNDVEAVEMTLRTLDYIVAGGIHDIVGGGFHRYTVDGRWLLPHFEKMLYDQALMLATLIESYTIVGDPVYRWASEKIVAFTLRELWSPEGGFYSALNSESGGVEGGFYTWTIEELREALGGEEFKLAYRLFNLSDKGNYYDEASGRLTGRNILYIGLPLRDASNIYGLNVGELLEFIDKVSVKLLKLRESRPKPDVDDKILADWNSLMISSLARTYQALGYSNALEASLKAARFIESRMVDGNIIYHSYRGGEAYIEGMLSDYASTSLALMDVYEATFKEHYLELSLELLNSMVRNFWDDKSRIFKLKRGGLTSDVLEPYDSAHPSGYSMAVHALIKASMYTGEPKYSSLAEEAVKGIADRISRAPSAFTYLLSALDLKYRDSLELVIAAENIGDAEPLIRELWTRYQPDKIILVVGGESGIGKIAPHTRNMVPVEGKPTLYACKRGVCDLPLVGFEAAVKALGARRVYVRGG